MTVCGLRLGSATAKMSPISGDKISDRKKYPTPLRPRDEAITATTIAPTSQKRKISTFVLPIPLYLNARKQVPAFMVFNIEQLK